MNADVWVNGVLVGRSGGMDGILTRHWNTPLLFSTPGSSWHEGLNSVHIRVAAYADNAGGLAPVHLGRFDVLSALHQTQRFWQNDLVYACNIGVIALGFFVLAVWVRRRDRADYGYFSLGAVLWGASNFNFTVREPPFSNANWELLVFVSIVWALLFLCLFTLRFSKKAPRWLERSVLIYALLYGVALSISGPYGAVIWGKYGLLPVLVLGAWSMWQGAVFVRRTRTVDYKILGIVQALTLVLGFYDWSIQAGYMPFTAAYGLPFAAPLLLAALGWWIAGDYARTHQELSQLNLDLEARVTEKENALRESFDRMAQLEKNHAVSQERSRIMRDMHDGVGMHLSSAIRQLQSGTVKNSLIEQTLRDSLDQLKLAVDSMSFRSGDVASLLGSLRYRLAPRFEAMGLTLHWQVDELPSWPQGDAANLRHVQHILFEIISNVLQHAQASELLLSVAQIEAEIIIDAIDNGIGMTHDTQLMGQGMRGVLQRAALCGASVQWLPTSSSAGCTVRVRLPI
jgi:signal transduction histidine kinase